jgi:two-component system response regulator
MNDPSAPKPAILIAEDDEDDFFLLSRELRKAGYDRMARAANGREVLDYLEAASAQEPGHPFPSAVFLDLKLPVLRGVEVLRAIRADSRWRQLPVFIQTGSDERRDRTAVAELGAQGYFVKPVVAAQIKSALG